MFTIGNLNGFSTAFCRGHDGFPKRPRYCAWVSSFPFRIVPTVLDAFFAAFHERGLEVEMSRLIVCRPNPLDLVVHVGGLFYNLSVGEIAIEHPFPLSLDIIPGFHQGRILIPNLVRAFLDRVCSHKLEGASLHKIVAQAREDGQDHQGAGRIDLREVTTLPEKSSFKTSPLGKYVSLIPAMAPFLYSRRDRIFPLG